MHTVAAIRPVHDILSDGTIDLPEDPGVYAFWWIVPKSVLMKANRHIVLKGPNGRQVNVKYGDWWPRELHYPCLYVGTSTNIKKRFSQHILRGCPDRLHRADRNNIKAKPHNSTCQLRFGIEHIFPRKRKPLGVILRSVGFSYRTAFPDNAIAERFFEEDRLVGTWRPWFNIDSER
jgi:hypothetical protein